jgi:hypothetical protein
MACVRHACQLQRCMRTLSPSPPNTVHHGLGNLGSHVTSRRGVLYGVQACAAASWYTASAAERTCRMRRRAATDGGILQRILLHLQLRCHASIRPLASQWYSQFGFQLLLHGEIMRDVINHICDLEGVEITLACVAPWTRSARAISTDAITCVQSAFRLEGSPITITDAHGVAGQVRTYPPTTLLLAWT